MDLRERHWYSLCFQFCETQRLLSRNAYYLDTVTQTKIHRSSIDQLLADQEAPFYKMIIEADSNHRLAHPHRLLYDIREVVPRTQPPALNEVSSIDPDSDG